MAAGGRGKLTLALKPEHYPFWSQRNDRLKAIKRVELFARSQADIKIYADAQNDLPKDALVVHDALPGMRAGPISAVPPPAPTGALTLYTDNNNMEDLFIGLTWGAS